MYEKEKRGRPPYDPRRMMKLLVYGYSTGVFSSRRLQKRLQEDIPFKVLGAALVLPHGEDSVVRGAIQNKVGIRDDVRFGNYFDALVGSGVALTSYAEVWIPRVVRPKIGASVMDELVTGSQNAPCLA